MKKIIIMFMLLIVVSLLCSCNNSSLENKPTQIAQNSTTIETEANINITENNSSAEYLPKVTTSSNNSEETTANAAVTNSVSAGIDNVSPRILMLDYEAIISLKKLIMNWMKKSL